MTKTLFCSACGEDVGAFEGVPHGFVCQDCEEKWEFSQISRYFRTMEEAKAYGDGVRDASQLNAKVSPSPNTSGVDPVAVRLRCVEVLAPVAVGHHGNVNDIVLQARILANFVIGGDASADKVNG